MDLDAEGRKIQAVDKGLIAALLQKDQILAYSKYASTLIFFLHLALGFFSRVCQIDFVGTPGKKLLFFCKNQYGGVKCTVPAK